MIRTLIQKALEDTDERLMEPIRYVQRNYIALKEKYGEEVVYILGRKVRASARNTSTNRSKLVKRAEAEYVLPGPKAVVGTIEGLKRGKYTFIGAHVAPDAEGSSHWDAF
jgi:hypothetical protein